MDVAAVARRMWVHFETYHDVTYFTPESRAATDELGCRGGWMGYFGNRAAPLGAVDPDAVTSAFYNFHPARVARALPDAWRIATPDRYLAARLTGADGALRRMLGADALASAQLAEAAGLAGAAAERAATAGRPLAAANAALDHPEPAHLALWQSCTTLRESRGDGHVAALVVAGLDPCETLVAFAADSGLDPAYLRQARGWSEEEWAAAAGRLADRGLLTESGALTGEGTELRRWVEHATDTAAAAPWAALGERRTDRLTELLAPLVRRLAEGNDVMRTNPMALDAAAQLTG
jgi:hypothetical protein